MRRGNFRRILAVITMVATAVMAFPQSSGNVVYAQESTVSIEGKQYELEENSKYTYLSSITPTTISSSGSQFGSFNITGNLTSISSVDGFTAYEVTSGLATLSYAPIGRVVGAPENDWHLIEDKGNEVNGEKLENKILSGAVILQTSIDGQKWITDSIKINIAGSGTDYKKDFYETPEIQLINGCYYRVLVVYELQRTVAKQHWYSSDKEQKKYVESYEFYLKDTSETVVNTGAHPNTLKVVGDMTNVTNTGKDNGYSGQNAITTKDPHYGWKLGDFTLRGYTNTADYQGEEYFLKNLGDAITLTFRLNQDINCLNGNNSLSIAEDKNGSDQYFQVPKSNFKHGTLIIRFTDFQGNKSEPIIYTDFLAANARTGADTRVQFFEEGDYEVALDYEIKDSSGIDSYTNYRMFFKFKIRNGNNMVYAFDSSGQLADKAWTASGFTINTANSHYLTVTVDKYAVVDGVGGKKLDQSWSRTASDGNSYKDEGVYIVTVSNRYQPNGDVSKTFYVGNDPYIKAIPITGKSLDEIVNLIKYTDYDIQTYLDVISKERKSLDEIVDLVKQGWTIDESGQLIAPPTPTPVSEEESVVEETEVEETEVEEIESDPKTEEESNVVEETPTPTLPQTPDSSQSNELEEQSDESLSAGEEGENDNNKTKSSSAPIIVLIAIAASACGVMYARSKKKNEISSDEINNDKKGEEE